MHHNHTFNTLKRPPGLISLFPRLGGPSTTWPSPLLSVAAEACGQGVFTVVFSRILASSMLTQVVSRIQFIAFVGCRSPNPSGCWSEVALSSRGLPSLPALWPLRGHSQRGCSLSSRPARTFCYCCTLATKDRSLFPGNSQSADWRPDQAGEIYHTHRFYLHSEGARTACVPWSGGTSRGHLGTLPLTSCLSSVEL